MSGGKAALLGLLEMRSVVRNLEIEIFENHDACSRIEQPLCGTGISIGQNGKHTLGSDTPSSPVKVLLLPA